MKALGLQIILELKGCRYELLDDEILIEGALKEAARVAGAHIIGSQFHKFSPHGVSGIVVISESHITIHTWPEYGYAAIDVFTCGDGLDKEAAISCLKTHFKPDHVTVKEMKRGILDLPPEEVHHKPSLAAVARVKEG